MSQGEIMTGAMMLLTAAFIGFLMLGPPRWPDQD
ncbi:MAG: hypothetical protein QOK05_1705 [Chloroflexota bacterium]|jgi:hypothetical protein|nr:hypothetical protein [Chloroflexota bacterium]